MIKPVLQKNRLAAKLDKTARAVDPHSRRIMVFLKKRAQWQIAKMKARTLQSTDIYGRQFKEYSDRYKEYRLEKGRPGTPDLVFTGKYMASWGHREERPGSLIMGAGIGKAVKTHAGLANKLDKKRKHWGYTKTERQKHAAAYKRFAKGLIRGTSA